MCDIAGRITKRAAGAGSIRLLAHFSPRCQAGDTLLGRGAMWQVASRFQRGHAPVTH
jgi:hypothetical protein